MEVLKVNFDDHRFILKRFIANLGEHQNHFRYFNNRPIETIKTHLVTLLFLKDSIPVAYGHLEKEGKDLWLGVATAYGYAGMGLGTIMLDNLIAYAKLKKELNISLTVDKENEKAINLYKKKGFTLTKEFPDYYKFMLSLK